MAPGILTLTINPAVDLTTSVERIEPTRKLRCAGQTREPGGGGINVARVVRRLGADVTAIYTAGGVVGEMLTALVAAESVRGEPAPIEGDTRENVMVDETSTGLQYRFVLPGPELRETEWRGILDRLERLEPFPAWVVASGSLAPGAPADFYRQAAAVVKARGGKLILDTSGAALKQGLGPGVCLIKPNLEELAELVGASPDAEFDAAAACREIVAAGKAEIVALTLGADGAMLVTGDGVWRAPAVKIKPASAVGAGDSFVGGMVWSLSRGDALETAFRYGMAAGAAALLTPGTGLCRADDIHRLYASVEMIREA